MPVAGSRVDRDWMDLFSEVVRKFVRIGDGIGDDPSLLCGRVRHNVRL